MSTQAPPIGLTSHPRMNGYSTRPDSFAAFKSLASDIATDAKTLVEQHGSLLKAEIVESRNKAIRSVVCLGIGAVLAPIAALFLLIGLVHLTTWLFPTLPEWGAWLIWSGTATLVGGITLAIGVRGVIHLKLIPHRTLNSLKESWSCLLNRLK